MRQLPEILKPSYFFDSARVEYPELFEGASAVWEIVARLQEGSIPDSIVKSRFASVSGAAGALPRVIGSPELRIAEGARLDPFSVVLGEGGLLSVEEGASVLPGTVITVGAQAVHIGRGARIGPNAHLDASKGGICVGAGASVCQGAYLRERSLIGSGAVIGNSSEIKCSIIGSEAEVPHFNYVGDSIFGYKAHIGAGVKISNLKLAREAGKLDTVKIKLEDAEFDTNLRKFGAVLGDRARMGCNSVANPGTLIGRNSVVYACCSIRGFIPENTLVKLRSSLECVRLLPV